jgi:hypothetical protein
MWNQYLIVTGTRIIFFIAGMFFAVINDLDFYVSLLILNSINTLCILFSLMYLRSRVPLVS